jgi:hypothetical protein
MRGCVGVLLRPLLPAYSAYKGTLDAEHGIQGTEGDTGATAEVYEKTR